MPFGSDTMWASATAACDRLPYALKLLFLNLDIEHDTENLVKPREAVVRELLMAPGS